jgi:PAS domain S-box-containing protein
MRNSEKSKEVLIQELQELQKSFRDMSDHYDTEISRLKGAAEKGSKSEELFRKAFSTSPDSVNINRLSDGMYISINTGFTKLLGYTEEEVIGKSSIELNIWADPDNRKKLVIELEEKRSVENFEARFRSKDGSVIYGLMSASLIDLDGVPHIINVTRDITRRRKIDETLEREQFLVNALMNNLTDHIYFKDLESRFIRINKSHALSFGLDDPAQVVGKSDFDFFTKEHAQQAFDDEQKIINTGEAVSKEEKLTRENRPDNWSYTKKLPLRDTAGNIIGTFGISRDITDQKRSELALKQSEERFRSVTQTATDAIITVDSKGIILGWNKGAERAFGFSEPEITGKSLDLIIPSEYSNKHIKGMIRIAMKGEKQSVGKTAELQGLTKGGTSFPLEMSLSDWETADGKFFTGIIRDISIRKRSELENQVIYEITHGVTSTSNLDELLKLIHQSLMKVVYAENCFVALFNKRTGLFSFPYFEDKIDSTPDPTTMTRSCSAYVFRTGNPFLYTDELLKQLEEKNEVEKVGSASPSWIGIPLQTPSKIIGVLVLQHYEKENVYSDRDLKFLTSIGSQIAIAIERKKSEEEIVLKNEMLQAINAEKDKFFSIIAHDLRGPLSSFVAATQIITEEIQNMSIDEIKEITLSMKTSATGIYNLLENLLEWSRLRRGGMNFIPEKINLRKKVLDCVDVLSESAHKKEIEIEVTIPDDIEILADNHMFDAIVRNLVSNALKFTTKGGKIALSSLINKRGFVEVSIKDNGIGMPAELRDKLFKLSEKTNRPGTNGEISTGLGLLLCKEFIEKNGGKIWVESEVGQGSTFHFSLPVEDDDKGQN